jgi:WD40 repeat protein
VNGEPVDHAGRVMLAGMSRASDDHPRAVVSLLDMNTGGTARPVMPTPSVQANSVPGRLATTAEGTRLVAAVGTAIAVVDVPRADFALVNGEFAIADPIPLFSADQRFAAIATTQPQPMVRLWDTATGTELASTANRDGLRLLRFSSDGSRLLARDQGVTHLVVLEVPSLRVIARHELPAAEDARRKLADPSAVLCVAGTAAPDTVVVLFAGLISQINLTSGSRPGDPVQAWRTDQEFERLLGGTVSCSTRPGSDEIAFDAGPSVQVRGLNRGTHMTFPNRAGPIAGVRFSPDGRLLAVLGFDGTMEIWDVERRQPVGSPLKVVPTSLAVRIIDFPARDRIIVGGMELIRIWDLDRRGAIASMELKPLGSNPAVTPDGGTLLFWNSGSLTRMPLDARQWATHLCRTTGRDLTDAERQILPPGSPTERICPG